jgi:hypothetical protein
MRLYIAGPMTGIEDFNYPEFFRVERELRDRGYDVLNPARINEMYNRSTAPRTWRWYMKHSITMVAHADGLATLPGWVSSRGASLEVHLARRLEMPVRAYHDWTDVRVGEVAS